MVNGQGGLILDDGSVGLGSRRLGYDDVVTLESVWRPLLPKLARFVDLLFRWLQVIKRISSRRLIVPFIVQRSLS